MRPHPDTLLRTGMDAYPGGMSLGWRGGGSGCGAVGASSASSTSAAADALPKRRVPLGFVTRLMTPSSLCSEGETDSRSAAGSVLRCSIAHWELNEAILPADGISEDSVCFQKLGV